MADGGSKRSKMSDEELLNLIRSQEHNSLGSSVAAGATISSTVFPSNTTMNTLEVDRYNALNAYWARPFGNEVENQSQVVLPELRDTIEWVMPQLMRMFTGSKQICRFDPEGKRDTEQAQMETDAVNHIFLKENNGFFVLHDFFKDALLMRNGYVDVTWVEEKVTGIERYSGLLQDELAEVMETEEGEEIEVLEQREYPITEHPDVQEAMEQGAPAPQLPPPSQMSSPGISEPSPTANLMQAPVSPPAPTPVMCWDVKLRRTEVKGRVKVQCIPPEEMRVSARTRGNMEEADFAQHITNTPRSDLIADGYDRGVIDNLTPGKQAWFEMDALARNQVVDQLTTESTTDKSMQEIEVRRNVLRVDRDGDGIAELRRVLVAGNQILDDEEIEETPFASCVPKRMPHRHTGISLYDDLMDLQIIKSQLFRAGLTNLALANNTRVGVDWKNCNLDDLLTSRPGGVVRTNGPPSNVLFPLVQPSNMMEQVVPTMEYVDTMRTMRTGVGKDTMGLDADALQDVTKGGQLASMSAASLKIELVARFLAEGVKNIFEKIRNCVVRHQDGKFEIEVYGKWVSVDPTDWKPHRNKMTVSVGLGSGNREEARANVVLMGQMQAQLAPLGLIQPKNAYETFKRGCEVLGYENPQAFAVDPASDEYKQMMDQNKANPPPEAPQVQVAKIRAGTVQTQEQAQTQRTLMEAKVDLVKAQTQAVQDHAQADRDTAHEVLQNHHDRQTDMAQIESQQGIALMKIIGQIIASQLKQDPSADGGAMLKKDYQEVTS